ncbi:ribonuclease P protein subunit [Vulcanisaeta sp. JCM 16161]|uniref:ribonuclease P protein subunit n=1 Tax=Vulcanisaeta sp. JCM 16161 TaxID=1295372 RepID=UPI0006CFAC65|nr:ribonuclease P protein subunit [Vulcanisaeta sp. JCM 16161]
MSKPLLFKFIETVNCRNDSLNGISGIVIDETAKTIKVLTLTGSIKVVIKEDCWFYVDINNCTYLVNGRRLILKGGKGKFFKFVK